jgi:uncharacterized protein YndB with AHSA1/START domain
METSTKTTITIRATIQAPMEKAWVCWTEPQHITKWNQASDDWHTPYAENDLRVGGKFRSTMAAKDVSVLILKEFIPRLKSTRLLTTQLPMEGT